MQRMLSGVAVMVGILCVVAWLVSTTSDTPLFSGFGSRGADIVFSEARLVPEDGGLRVDANADIVLPDAVRLGLDSGVPLEFVVELTLFEPRTPWPDQRLLTERWRYRLIYYELTRHYRINAVDGSGSRNYRSLTQALDGLGSVRASLDVPTNAGRVATLNMHMDSTRLPLPLRPIFGGLWRGSWAIHGQVYRWTFDLPEPEASA